MWKKHRARNHIRDNYPKNRWNRRTNALAPTHSSHGAKHLPERQKQPYSIGSSVLSRDTAAHRFPQRPSAGNTFATKILKEGMTLNDVRLLLGHSSIQTTQRYQHLESSDVSPKAVEILNRQNVARNRAKIKLV
jgi:site-specific recombinase XerC